MCHRVGKKGGRRKPTPLGRGGPIPGGTVISLNIVKVKSLSLFISGSQISRVLMFLTNLSTCNTHDVYTSVMNGLPPINWVRI